MKDKKRVQDILSAIESIEVYRVSTYDEFLSKSKTQDAILYNLIIIGESANRVSEKFQEQYPEIPWSSIIGTRNIIVHGYDQIKLQIVWKILQHDLENLKSGVLEILKKI
jgi:uncharacterized protein with HEPN domain